MKPFFANIERNVSNIALAALVLALGLQVFFRYVLQIGLSWSEEVSRFLFVGFVYVSASHAVQKGTHIRVSFMVDRLPPRLQTVAWWLADLIWIGFNALVVASGVVLIQGMIAHPVYSSSLFVPLAAIYALIPLAHGLMIIRILQTRFGGPGSQASPGGPGGSGGGGGPSAVTRTAGADTR